MNGPPSMLCVRCRGQKLRENIYVDYGNTCEGLHHGGLCIPCHEKLEAERLKLAGIGAYLAIEPDVHTYGNRSYESYEG